MWFCRIAVTIAASLAIASAQESSSTPVTAPAPAPTVTFKAASRMVTVEVVARDHKGQAVHGLNANDFQVFEQVVPKREQHPQKIAAFRATSIQEIAAQDSGKPQMSPGVYTNLITMNKVPVPPTILLLDGLNTDRVSQMQVHQQVVHIIESIPDNVPTAVFLLGRRLRMVQNFTTDPKLLKAAVQNARSPGNPDPALDPRDDPDAMSAVFENNPDMRVSPQLTEAIRRFEQERFAFQLDTRVQETVDALRGIAWHVAGYPGRKNLLWISSSFPILFLPDASAQTLAMRNYDKDVTQVAKALADAKVAVYPVDPGGLHGLSIYETDTQTRRDRQGMLNRQVVARISREETMQSLADQTGGKICVSDNDLSDCVKRAMDDSSFFYEIAYYPDSGDWHGEFHKIILKSTRSGVRLSYRQGYYALGGGQETNPKAADEELQRAACGDVLTATSVLMVAKQFPEPGKIRYFVAMEPNTITFTPAADGSRQVALKFALCSFDKLGKPVRFLQGDIDETITDKQYAEAQAEHGFPRVISFVPTPGIAMVRILIKDTVTGEMGSVNIPYVETTAATSSSAPPTGGAQHAAAPQ